MKKVKTKKGQLNSEKETNYLLSGKNREVLLKSVKEARQGKLLEKGLLENG